MQSLQNRYFRYCQQCEMTALLVFTTVTLLASVVSNRADVALACGDYLGLISGRIQDFQITVSSSQPNHHIEDARARPESTGWCPEKFDSYPYLQVDFVLPTIIEGLLFYYFPHPDEICLQDVRKTIHVHLGNSTSDFIEQPAINNLTQVFSMEINRTSHEPFYFDLLSPVLSRYIRILLGDPEDVHYCLKFEAIGCREEVHWDLHCGSREENGTVLTYNSTDAGLKPVNIAHVSSEAVTLFDGENSRGPDDCQEMCKDMNESCFAAIFNQKINSCYGYKAPEEETPSFIYKSEELIPFQRMCLSNDLPAEEHSPYPTSHAPPGFPYTSGSTQFNFLDPMSFIYYLYFGDPHDKYSSPYTGNVRFLLVLFQYLNLLEGDSILISGAYSHVLQTSDILLEGRLTNKNPMFAHIEPGRLTLTYTRKNSSLLDYHKEGAGFKILNIDSNCNGYKLYIDAPANCRIDRWPPPAIFLTDNYWGYDGTVLGDNYRSWEVTTLTDYLVYLQLTIQYFSSRCEVGSYLRTISSGHRTEEYCNMNRPWPKMLFRSSKLTVAFLFSNLGWHAADGIEIGYQTTDYSTLIGHRINYNNYLSDFGVTSNNRTVLSYRDPFILLSEVYFNGDSYIIPSETVGQFHHEPAKRGGSMTFAKSICAYYNHSHITSVHSAVEQRFLRLWSEQLLETEVTTIRIGNISSTDGYANKRYMKWEDGTPLVYTAWDSSVNIFQNDYKAETCVAISIGIDDIDDNNWIIVEECNPNSEITMICKQDVSTAEDKLIIEPLQQSNFTKSYSLHLCGSGEMISLFSVCDGHEDCLDGLDEMNCDDECYDRFRCDDGQCIAYSGYCDFHRDCKDDSDEKYCDFTRECNISAEWRCSSGQCVSSKSRCNASEECVDGSDEFDCESCDEETSFLCENRKCIPIPRICDGFKDCPGEKSEEDYCEDETVPNFCSDYWDMGKRATKLYSLYSADFCWDPKTRYQGSWSHTKNGRTCQRWDSQEPHSHLPNIHLPDDTEEAAANYCREEADDQTRLWCYTMDPTVRIEDCVVPICESGSCTVECDFDRTYADGRIITKFHNIDFAPGYQSSDVSSVIIYEEVGIIMHHVYKFGCTQTFVQDCPPNRMLIADQLDLRTHTDFWDCLCIELVLELGMNNESNLMERSRSYRPCSEATLQLQAEGLIDLERKFIYRDIRFSDDSDNKLIIFNNESATLGSLPGTSNVKPRFSLGPVACTEDIVPENVIICKRGLTAQLKEKCLYDFDGFGYITGCTDRTHLQNCEEFECPYGFVKCPNSYCIPTRFICDNSVDCIGGEDEVECNIAPPVCTGYYRCKYGKNASVCIPPEQVCDGRRHCEHGDDERLCDVTCPHGCRCQGYDVDCHGSLLSIKHTQTISLNTRRLDLSGNQLIVSPQLQLNYLAFLNMSNCGIEEIEPDSFQSMSNLLTLDLRSNQLTFLRTYSFRGLRKLTKLLFGGNFLISSVEPMAFFDLESLEDVDLTHTNLKVLRQDVFVGLASVKRLDLSRNALSKVEDEAFNGLDAVLSLDIRENNIREFSDKMFNGLRGLKELKSDSYVFCCYKPSGVNTENCIPGMDEFSSCDDLMRVETARFILWVIGFLTMIGNVLSLAYRFFYDRKSLKIGYGIFVTNLCIADFLMGIYLIIVAAADIHYRGQYIVHDEEWRHSNFCTIAGFLSMISSEASVLFVALVTLDRILVVKSPFGNIRIGSKGAVLISVAAWLVVTFLSLVPLIFIGYFKGEFYSTSAVCLALPLTNRRPAGWEYSMSIFVVLNLAIFILIAAGQGAIYREILAVHNTARRDRKHELGIARNLLFVVATDFCSWFPIGVMGIMALTGRSISGDVYMWTTVLLLPINATINPFLYTFLAVFRRKKFAPGVSDDTTEVKGFIDVEEWKQVMNSKMFRFAGNEENPTMTLAEKLNLSGIKANMAVMMLVNLTARISFLHKRNLYHGHLTMKNVWLVEENGTFRQMILDLKPQAVMKQADRANDVQQIGAIARSLLVKIGDR